MKEGAAVVEQSWAQHLGTEVCGKNSAWPAIFGHFVFPELSSGIFQTLKSSWVVPAGQNKRGGMDTLVLYNHG